MTDILAAIDDPALLGAAIRNPSAWRPWRGLLAAAFGLDMDDEAAARYRACTGRQALPTEPFQFLWLCIGRRGGKSFAMSILAVFLACFKSWKQFLSPGERAVILLVAADREQSKILIRYVNGILSTPILQSLVVGATADTLEVQGGVVIEVVTRSYRSVRGRSVCVAILDELAFWRDENSSDPDVDVVNAIRASMASFGKDGMMIGASSPYAKRGVLWDAFARFYGKEDTANLFWRASTSQMNPTITQEFLDGEQIRNPESFNSEYLAEFRSDVALFVDRARVEAVVIKGRRELPPLANVHYVAFVDASGGSAASMAIAIAHRSHEGKAVLDCTREVLSPLSPDAVTEQFATLLRGYGVQRVTGDNFGGLYPAERFQAYGIAYQKAERSKSDIYRDALPLINSEQVELLDDSVLINQLCSLERKVSAAGRETVGPPKDRRDDVVNSACGAIVNVSYQCAPRILRYSDFLHRGLPVAVPTSSAYRRFRSVAADRDGKAAIITWAASSFADPNLVLVDFEAGFFVDLKGAPMLLSRCVSECSHGARVVAACEGLYALEEKDFMKEFSAAAAAGRAVSGGRVKVSHSAHKKSETAAIGACLDFTIDRLHEPLTAAAVCGIFKLLIAA